MFAINDIVVGPAEERFRVLHVDHSLNLVEAPVAWVFDLDDRNALPVARPLSKLIDEIASKEYSVLQPENHQVMPKRSDRARKRAKDAMDMIRPLIVYPDIFDPAWRGPHVAQEAERQGCSPQTLMSHLRRYFRGGQTGLAMLMDFHRSGISTINDSKDENQYVVGNTKRRGSKTEEYYTYQMTTTDHEKIKQVAETSLKKSTAHAVNQIIIKHYSFADGNGNSFSKPFGERPSKRQIRYSIEKQFSLETRLRKKHGDNAFELDMAPTLASAVESVRGVGEVYEIDATIFDCQLVARADRGRTIGKATGYHIIDRRSQLCPTFYITLETAAWSSAVLAICTLAESKRELCERYKVPYDPTDWPAEGLLPSSFAADRGEMLCRNSDSVPLLGIRVTNNPPRMPRRKGLVEASFHIIPQIVSEETPGYEVPSEFRKRTGKKYGQDATLNLDEFIRTMLIGQISYNRRVMLDYPAPTEMRLAGTPITPINVWNWEIAQGRGFALRRFPEETLRLHLLPVDDATITGSGIEFRGLTYRCDELEFRGAFVAAVRNSSTLKVSYDSRLVDTIYVHDPRGSAGEFLLARLSRECDNYLGLSFPEVKAIQSTKPKQRQQKEQTAADSAVFRHQHLDAMFENAKAETKKASAGKSRASRRADMADDRNAELRARRSKSSVASLEKEFGPQPESQTVPPEQPRPADSSAAGKPAAPHPLSLAARLAAKRQELLNGK